ncbi:ABC-2 type transport system permease protein [Algoriphagus sp. 4150]|uniref:DUF3526 domain-containing protein n=1 Tax=Algoriphagus sp. 4150 TaxID=2817756 RepID=UPI002863A0EA|nr:DUF3526 domain-containing protein [Algoriphagus sp. 4150]MDR7132569.1 ABC-2 type transport system permease protein [Algoriphagus sp. 4150]
MGRSQLIVFIQKEVLSAFRDRTVIALAAVCFALMLFASYAGWQRFQSDQQIRHAASERFEHEWEDQEANPHSAAHFGTYLFKEPSVLGVYDPGLNTFLGTTYRVEAHVQHELNQAEIGETDINPRLGELSVAFVCQLLIPLLIFLLTFQSFSKERQSGTLRLLWVQGVPPITVLLGKIGGIYTIVLLILLPIFALLAFPFALEGTSLDLSLRYAAIAGVYLVYFFIITCIGVALSVWISNPRAALVCSMGIWLFWSVLMPRALVRLVDAEIPLPSRYEFDRNISRGYRQGLDQDGSSLERSKNYLAETLEKYGVDSVSQLPVNFDGLSMQYGEDYNTKVYEHYAGDVESMLILQNDKLELLSLLDPFVAVKQLSMGFAGTDYHHHLAFHKQAKSYRDGFIRVLNMDLAYSGSEYLSYDYKVGSEFFASMEDFEFLPPLFKEAVGWHKGALAVLIIWTGLVAGVVIPLTVRHLNKEL